MSPWLLCSSSILDRLESPEKAGSFENQEIRFPSRFLTLRLPEWEYSGHPWISHLHSSNTQHLKGGILTGLYMRVLWVRCNIWQDGQRLGLNDIRLAFPFTRPLLFPLLAAATSLCQSIDWSSPIVVCLALSLNKQCHQMHPFVTEALFVPYLQTAEVFTTSCSRREQSFPKGSFD